MSVQNMNMKYLRIAELSENIEKLNKIIELHQNTTNDDSMIRQYVYKKEEQILELQEIFATLNLNILQRGWNINRQIAKVNYNIQIPDKEKLRNHITKLEQMFTALGDEINEISQFEFSK